MSQASPSEFFSDPHAFLGGITDRLHEVRRWKRYARPGHEFEDVCAHTVQQATLCLIMLELERAHGDPNGIDGERLLACALLHDQGEGLLGDVAWYAKQDPRVKQGFEEMEREAFDQSVVTPLPASIAPTIERHFALQDDLTDRTGRFFRTSEVVGYMIRAIHEYRGGHRLLGQHVFVHQYEDIVAWAKEFAAARLIFDTFQGEVERALREDPACIAYAAERGKTARFQQLLAEHGGNGAVASRADVG